MVFVWIDVEDCVGIWVGGSGGGAHDGGGIKVTVYDERRKQVLLNVEALWRSNVGFRLCGVE